MPQSMTNQGVAGGKRDREFEGDTNAIYDEWTLSDYDPDADGTGNDFDPEYIYGYSRVKTCHVHVADGSAYRAVYDYANKVIRLYNLDGTGEVGNNTTVNVDLRVEVRGN